MSEAAIDEQVFVALMLLMAAGMLISLFAVMIKETFF